MIIRKAKTSDVPFIRKKGLEVKEFQVIANMHGFWSKKDLINWIKSKNDIFLVAEEKKKIIGFVMFALHVPTGKVTLENVWVDPKHRGRKIASKLLKEAEKILKKKGNFYLCSLVKTDATASIKFHEKNKFKKGYKFIWFYKKI
jgi:ribosomal protein S18 acetylase RimI-like enzyme